MVNSRTKGRRGEREVCKILQNWWRQLEPDCIFVPTPQSGGWASARVRGEFRAAGDIMTTAALFGFTVECKFREAWSLAGLEKGHRSPVWAWWRQAQEQAREEGGVPMLWFRRSRQPWRVMLPRLGGFDQMYDRIVNLAGGSNMAWTFSQLADRDVGLLPVVFMAEDLVRVAPSILAKGVRA